MRSKGATVVLALVVVTNLAACTHPGRYSPPPDDIAGEAEIPGMPGVRYGVDDIDAFVADALQAYEAEHAWRKAQGETGPRPLLNYLAISGGGDNGAFGAGVLVGWTEAGTRPDFKLVSGISTGALTAPFAFVGPRYDDALREVYTTIGEKDLLRRRSVIAAISNDALADTAPLRRVVARYVDEDLLRAVAEEHRKGKMLLVLTTNLDAQTGVIWNMGKIAASGHPQALDLFRSVLIASAAIPGAFPPVMIDVEVDGQLYQEMHVDGGVTAQVFIYPTAFSIREEAGRHNVETAERRLFIIRNARIDPTWARVDRQALRIAGRAIGTLIQSQGAANLFWLYVIAQRDGIDYNLAFIGRDFDTPRKGQFDTAYMNELYRYGYGQASAGYDWRKRPVGFGVPARAEVPPTE